MKKINNILIDFEKIFSKDKKLCKKFNKEEPYKEYSGLCFSCYFKSLKKQYG